MTAQEDSPINPLGALTRPSGDRRQSLLRALVYGLVLATLAASWRSAEMDPLQLVRDFGNIVKEVREFFPPDFTDWREYVQ